MAGRSVFGLEGRTSTQAKQSSPRIWEENSHCRI